MAYLFLVSKGAAQGALLDGVKQSCKAALHGYLDGDCLEVLKSGFQYDHVYALCRGQINDFDKAFLVFKKHALQLPFDAWLMSEVPSLQESGLLVMDMDMTAVQIEGIDEIARELGVYDEVAKVTAEAMHGKLEFAASLIKRAGYLKSTKSAQSVLDAVKARMRETDGLQNLLPMLKSNLWHLGIASGGFTQLIDVIKDKYGIDFVRANTLIIKNDQFTGEVAQDIVDAQKKQEALLSWSKQCNVPKSRCICLGDGANDLLMIKEAGYGFAYHAKPKVRQQSPYLIDHSDLSAVCLLLKIAGECHGQN